MKWIKKMRNFFFFAMQNSHTFIIYLYLFFPTRGLFSACIKKNNNFCTREKKLRPHYIIFAQKKSNNFSIIFEKILEKMSKTENILPNCHLLTDICTFLYENIYCLYFAKKKKSNCLNRNCSRRVNKWYWCLSQNGLLYRFPVLNNLID